MFNIIGKAPDLRTKRVQVKKIVIILILVAIIVFSIITIIAYKMNENFRNFIDYSILRKEVLAENTVKIPINNVNISNVYAYNRSLVVLNKNMLEIYNNFGQKERDLEITISNPIFANDNRFLSIAEKDGNKIYLINGENIAWQKDLEGKINNVAVNKNGYVSVSVSGSGYKTTVILFNPSGEELFKTYFRHTYVLNMDISKDNKYLAISEADVNGTKIQTGIKVIHIENAKNNPDDAIVGKYNTNSPNIVSNIKYHDKAILISMYDNGIFNTDDSMDKLQDITANVLFADIEATNNIITVEKVSGGIFKTDYVLKMFDIFSSRTVKHNLLNMPKEIYIKNDIVAINYGTEAEFVATSGWLVKKYKTNSEIKQIVMANNMAGIICKDNIEIVDL